MPRCTCGATLPEDALFCHRCGKPQRELLAVEPESAPAIPPPIPVATVSTATPIGFHNGPAVRFALLAGLLSIIVLMITGQVFILQVLMPLWLMAAGFFAVFLYRRKTGECLTPLNGAHLGWLSGFFGFLIITVLLTLFAVAMSEPSVVSALRAQLSAAGKDADFNAAFEQFHSPAKIAVTLLKTLLLFSVLPAFGGALGAKFPAPRDLARRD